MVTTKVTATKFSNPMTLKGLIMSTSLATTNGVQMTSPIVRPQAVAVNATFHNKASHYVTLADRLNQYLRIPVNAESLDLAQMHWRSRYPQIKQWDQIVLGQAQSVPLSHLQIDTTLQREVLFQWLCLIIQEFRDLRVMPISVYRDKNQSNSHMLTCWDGQHTALSLWVICTQILKLDPDKCMVPVFIHPSTSREQMRENFTELNGPAKKPVSNAELFRQEVLGVRVDQSTRPSWKESELKQCILEKHQLFVCDKESMLRNQPGAISNMSEILATGTQGKGKHYHMQDLALFCELMDKAAVDRAIQSMEMWQWMDYFRACRMQGIQVNSKYLSTLVKFVNTCFLTFNSKVIHDKGQKAYTEWYKYDRPLANGMLYGQDWLSNKKCKELHLCWLSSLVAKWTNLVTPKVMGMWQPEDKWLDIKYLRD